MSSRSKATKAAAAGALVLAGFGVGAVLAATGSASATSDTASGSEAPSPHTFDPSKSIRPDEHLLSGTTASKVRAAALAKYPNATIQRVETDSDGVYEAHIVTSDGRPLIVAVGKDFSVTGTEAFGGPDGRGGPGRPGGPGARGDGDGDGPDAPGGGSSTAPQAYGT